MYGNNMVKNRNKSMISPKSAVNSNHGKNEVPFMREFIWTPELV